MIPPNPGYSDYDYRSMIAKLTTLQGLAAQRMAGRPDFKTGDPPLPMSSDPLPRFNAPGQPGGGAPQFPVYSSLPGAAGGYGGGGGGGFNMPPPAAPAQPAPSAPATQNAPFDPLTPPQQPQQLPQQFRPPPDTAWGAA